MHSRSSQWRTKLGVCQFHGAVNRAANDETVVWCRILQFMVAIVIECGPRMRSSGVLFSPLSGGLWLSVDGRSFNLVDLLLPVGLQSIFGTKRLV